MRHSQQTYLLILFILTVLCFMPQPANAINQTGWKLTCDNKNICKIYDTIISDKKVVVSSFSLVKLKIKGQKKKKLVGVVMLPLGLHIPSGIKISFDKKVRVKANLVECKLKGCRALFTAEKVIIDQMKKGQKIFITIVDSRSRKALQLQYGLKGFTKKYKEFLAKT